jgi:glyoxylase-like metal-dependent hydrolase (beta-lactamase superfamily II)
MVDTRIVGDQIYLIDDELYDIPGSGSVYLLLGDKNALIDTGPSTSIKTVLGGIRQIGLGVDDIDYIIVTHIHLDHSGGAGTLLKYATRAKLLAHHKAVKHLVDPSKLLKSATEAQGKETMNKNGEVFPIAREQIAPVHNGDIIKLSDKQVLTLFETPGHAPHEICILESRNRGIFVGDAVGHFIEGSDILIPITPPPSFDMELYLQSLEKLMQLKAERIFFAHAGFSDQVQEKLETAARKLRERDNIIARAASENKLDSAVEKLVEHICNELDWLKENRRSIFDCWAAGDIPMSAAEHVRYYRKKQVI